MNKVMSMQSTIPLQTISPQRATKSARIFEDTRLVGLTISQPWPVIAQFLESIPVGSIGLDSGCGNGKYLSLPSNRSSSLCTIGLDRSFNLLKIARQAGGVERDAVQGDALATPWREGIFVCSRSIMT